MRAFIAPPRTSSHAGSSPDCAQCRGTSAAASGGRCVIQNRRPTRRSTVARADVIERTPTSSDDFVGRVVATSSSNPIVVLPGFGNDSADYSTALGADKASIVKALKSRGFDVHVTRVERKDWFIGIFRGLLTRGFWMNACTTKQVYGWYLARVDEAVTEALRANPDKTQVDLVAHSAGGWLARAFIGGALALNEPGVECDGDCMARESRVASLTCLGTPHTQDARSDPTRGACQWVNDTWPGAYFDPDVKYTCVTGRSVVGNASADKGTIGKYSAGSYAVVAGGTGDGVEGDAVVPNSSALALDGAEKIIIDGCWHSMSTVGTFDQASRYPWYGADDVVDQWLGVLRRN